MSNIPITSERVAALLARAEREIFDFAADDVLFVGEGEAAVTLPRSRAWWALQKNGRVDVMAAICQPGAQPEGHLPAVLLFDGEVVLAWVPVQRLDRGAPAGAPS